MHLGKSMKILDSQSRKSMKYNTGISLKKPAAVPIPCNTDLLMDVNIDTPMKWVTPEETR
jgi:hypothetical protein